MRAFSVISAAICLLGLNLQAVAAPMAPDHAYEKIGIVPLRDEGNIRDGGEILTQMLAARLNARFGEAEFFVVELDEEKDPDGPLLLAEAMELCHRTGADALLDGVFSGVEVVGGTWPNKGGDHPQARGFLRWRLVEGEAGMLVTDGTIAPDKPQIYSQRIRTLKELQRRVMADLVLEVGNALEDCGKLPGTREEDQ